MGNLFCLHSRWCHFSHLIPLSSELFSSSSHSLIPASPDLHAGTPTLLFILVVFISYTVYSGVVAGKSIFEEPLQRPKKSSGKNSAPSSLTLPHPSSPSCCHTLTAGPRGCHVFSLPLREGYWKASV